MATKTSNSKSSEYSSQQIDFKGNNLDGRTLQDGSYVVLSYGYYPLYLHKKGKWYENSEKYSVSTSKQKTQSRPTSNTTEKTTKELLKLAGVTEFDKGGGVDNWIQTADKQMEKKGTVGLFTRKAKTHGKTPVEYAKVVLANPKKHSLKTRRQAQFVKNTNPEKFGLGGFLFGAALGGYAGYKVGLSKKQVAKKDLFTKEKAIAKRASQKAKEANERRKEKREKKKAEAKRAAMAYATRGASEMKAKGGEVLNIITFDNKVSRDEFLKEMNDVAPDNSLVILDDVSIQNMGAKSDVDFYNEQAKSFNGEFYAKGGEIQKMDWDEIEAKLNGLDDIKNATGSLSPKEIMNYDALEQEYENRKSKGYEYLTYEEIKEEEGDFAKGGEVKEHTFSYTIFDENGENIEENKITQKGSDKTEAMNLAKTRIEEGLLEGEEVEIYAKGGKTQGYNARLDESLGNRKGKKSTKKQSYKDRRDESKGMEKASGKRAYSSVKTMDKGSKYFDGHLSFLNY